MSDNAIRLSCRSNQRHFNRFESDRHDVIANINKVASIVSAETFLLAAVRAFARIDEILSRRFPREAK